MIKKYLSIILPIVMFAGMLALPLALAPAAAAADAQTIYKYGKDNTTSINDLVKAIITFLSVGVGIAVVVGIIIGGITYSTSQGNPGQANKGVTWIVNSILGLVLYLLLFTITNFLIPGGIFK